MVLSEYQDRPLRVAIIGAGPAGLGAAIAFSRLPFVSWTLYEKGDRVKEIGAGISIQRNTWQILEDFGAAKNIHPKDIYRPRDRNNRHHRNGRTGELVLSKPERDAPPSQLHARAHRAVLQNALLGEVDQSRIRLSSKLVDVQHSKVGNVVLTFQDGFQDEVDLVIGADGIRSVVRNTTFPEHRIAYTGKTSYRTLVKTSDVAQIPELLEYITFWHGKGGKWVYTTQLGDGVYEITTMADESAEGQDAVSWGQEARLEQMLNHYPEFHPIVLQLLGLAKNVQKYALFAGPHLDTVVDAEHGIALIGDASHPLSGAFGTGAGFALEDAWTLAESVEWAYEQGANLAAGLRLFDKVRSPHYAALYKVLDRYREVAIKANEANLDFDQDVEFRIKGTWSDQEDWIQQYDAAAVFRDYIKGFSDSHAQNNVHSESHIRGGHATDQEPLGIVRANI